MPNSCLPMLYTCIPPALSRRRLPVIAAFVVACLLYSWRGSPDLDEAYYRVTYPLAWKHVHVARGQGGVWYIPPDWLNPAEPVPTTILEAARLTHKIATDTSRLIPYSTIPLIIHQTWKNTKIDTWGENIAAGVEQWLDYAMAEGNSSLAYFLWLDEGCRQLIAESDPQIAEIVEALPLMVEKSDVFRVVVLNYIGGVYGDIDTMPLRSPASWLDAADISPWSDPQTGKSYGATTESSSHPVQLLLGIEGDNDPNTDTYWRTGYNFPVQLTQWALASATQNPILDHFVSNFVSRVKELALPYGGNVTAAASAGVLAKEDPLKLTGPEAITAATMERLKEESGLRWDALTGLADGGRSKAVGDTIIFPITAFSPGRGKYGNMGSKPITDPDARVWHRAQGSWKQHHLKVEYGKFCRTAFGMCRDWPKVPH